MTTKTPIEYGDIQVGDTIRSEWDATKLQNQSAIEYRVDSLGHRYGGAKRHFLLDRTKKIIHAKGTTFYGVTDGFSDWFKKGEAVTLAKDFCEGDRYLIADGNNGLTGGAFYIDKELSLTKPRKVKWAKGTKLWFVDSAQNRATHSDEIGSSITVKADVYEDARYVNGVYYTSRFTDVEPEVRVAVPLSAIKKLRDVENAAQEERTNSGANYQRYYAIRDFLNERSVRVALDGDGA